MTRWQESLIGAAPLLAAADLTDAAVQDALLAETARRRTLDLADLDPEEQARLLSERTAAAIPSRAALTEALARALTVKLGVDPTAAELHLGHAVPMTVLGRLHRMGHHPVLIVGDITARIGDPSGRSRERPPLSAADVARNMRTYRQQLAPFFDFKAAPLRHNSEWLAEVPLPELLDRLALVSTAALLQREDFRNKLARGHGLSVAQLIYPVVMALDSAKLGVDLELGGVDQLLNMQMGRTVMKAAGQRPQLIVTVPLLEGTDGTGAKMSKSLGNTIPLAAAADEMFGGVMSIPDRITLSYLRAFSEWTDAELQLLTRSAHPRDLKVLAAGEVVAAVHGLDRAREARASFAARFARRRFAALEGLPALDLAVHGSQSVANVLARVLRFCASTSAARRLATQGAIRMVVEGAAGRREVLIHDAARPLAEVVPPDEGTVYLQVGRRLARVTPRHPAFKPIQGNGPPTGPKAS
jgi:tyrosyl-tRNA synthetase